MKISIIGSGMVGTSIAYACMIKSIVREISLVDINKDLAEGNALDLSHGNPYIPSPVEINGGDYETTRGSDIVVITAGRPQKPGESRLELTQDNARIVAQATKETLKYCENPVFLIVSNPVDVMTWAAWKASGAPRSSVIGSGTTLDTARLRQGIAEHCHIDPRSVHAYVLGEHGDTEIVSWSSANVGGISISDFCSSCPKNSECKRDDEFRQIFEDTRDAAYRIIEKKGATYYGIGLAVSRVIQAILRDEHTVLNISTVHEDFGGLRDVAFSVPTVIGRKGAERPLPLKLSDEERKGLMRSVRTIHETIESIRGQLQEG